MIPSWWSSKEPCNGIFLNCTVHDHVLAKANYYKHRKYEKELEEWQAIPWWRKIFKPKPKP